MKSVIRAAFLSCIAMFLSVACSPGKPFVIPNPDIICGLTAGVISRTSTIKVLFNERVGERDRIAPKRLISFVPDIAGVAKWIDEYSLEFKPESELSPGKKYIATVRLDRIAAQGLSHDYFNFAFGVKKPYYTIAFDTLAAVEGVQSNVITLSGTIRTDDREDSGKVERMISFSPGMKESRVSWEHDAESLIHKFVISGIPKKKAGYNLSVAWNGHAIRSSEMGSRTFEIPALGEFKVMDIQPVIGEEEYIAVSFSEAVAGNQDFRGLIVIPGFDDLGFAQDGSVVRVYSPGRRFASGLIVSVAKSVKSASGNTLILPASTTVSLVPQKPAIRFPGKGTILPSSQGLTLPIETMNLSAIMVEAIRVYGDNMTQFLQVNKFDSDRELARVGKIVWQKVVNLGWSAGEEDVWVRRGLDLTQLVKKNPDGMFQLRVTFRKPHIKYPCDSALSEEDEARASVINFPELEGSVGTSPESSYWDYYESYNDDYYEWYNARMDPCNPAYYKKYYDHDIIVRKNVLVSNVGLLTKLGLDKKLHVAVTDLRTASPIAGASVEALDYTRQVIASGKSDKQGFVTLSGSEKPFFLVAKHGGQYGYLKLDDGSALSVSHFDTGGASLQAGAKGLIYAERGVWRPGDTIYLTFMLFDPGKKIPAKHPIQVEMANPRGQVEYKAAKTDSLDGFYPIPLTTKPDAMTGDWIVRVRLGGAVYTKTVKIENVMPNRLKIDLSFGGKQYLSGGEIVGRLTALWLHGAKAPGLKADLSVSYTAVPTTFAKYGEYVFDDPARDAVPGRQEIFSGSLDSDGEAEFSKPLNLSGNVSGKLRANFLARVFETSGVFSSEQSGIDCYPYSRFMGIKLPKGDEARGMLLTDTNHKASIVMVDADGNPVKQARVTAEIFKIKWRWWWEKQPETLADYASSASITKIQSGEVDILNGKGEWTFSVKYPDWGRYLVRVWDAQGGHSAGKIVYIDWPGWAGRGQKDGAGAASMLTLTSERQKYSVGDKIRITFPSNKDGAAIVSVESSGSIMKKEWIKPKPGTTTYEMVATPQMAPNVYLHVSFLQPHLQTANDLPIRLYGVIPIMVENPDTHIYPVISSADSFEPGSRFTVTVSESRGRPMTYTLAIVDEGLLGLTRFGISNPWNTFYAKEASLMKNWDLYDWVAGAYAGKLSTLLGIGGGDGELTEGGRKANRFPPVVRFEGPVSIGKGEKKTHSFPLPNYVGALRCMVTAGKGNAFGTAEKSVTVKSDLMVLGTLPRVLSPGERVKMPVTVFAYDPAIKSVAVTVSARGPVAIENNAGQTIQFAGPGDAIASFSLLVAKQTGVAALSIKATSNTGKTATSEVELDVRSLGRPVSKVIARLLDAGEEWEEKLTLPGEAGTNKLTIELSQLPPLDLEKRLRFLIQYPHGCIEQTTSSVFPQVSLDLLVDLTAERKAEIERNVKAGIERLPQFQTASGGFAYWPGDTEANQWGTSYAGHFLIQAKKRGYAVPQAMIDGLLSYQKKRSNEWDSESDTEMMQQAYRLYTLALAGSAEMGAMNRLREKKNLPVTAAWRLASAYQLAGQRDAGRKMVEKTSVNVKEYSELGGTYGSDLRDRAVILEALVSLDMMSLSEPLIKEISQRLSSDEWISTQSTAYALVALVPYAVKVGKDTPLAISYALDGGAYARLVSRGKMILADVPVGNAEQKIIKIKNESGFKVYPRIIARGTPLLENEKQVSNGIRMDIKYTIDSGSEVDPAAVEKGKDIIIDLAVTNLLSYNLENLALTALLPAGWEIINERLASNTESDERGSRKPQSYDYLDIKDDRVCLYFGLSDRQRDSYNSTKTFRVRVNNAYDGSFYLPACSVEAMYDAAIQAVIPGRWLSNP